MKHEVIDLDSIEDGVLRAGIDYWRRLKGNRAFPSSQQISPRQIGGLLRNLVLIKVVDKGEEYEFRIFGEEHVKASGLNMQGCHIRDLNRIWPSCADSVQNLYGQLLATKQPFALRAFRDDCPGLNPLVSEHVLLPLGANDASVDHILIFAVYASGDVEQRRAAG